jgi:hypothetical protein
MEISKTEKDLANADYSLKDDEPITLESLKMKVKELSTQNTFLKKKNHELTFRLMQLEREKNDRIRLKEAEEWYSSFCQKTNYSNGSQSGPPPSASNNPVADMKTYPSTSNSIPSQMMPQQQQQGQSLAQIQQQMHANGLTDPSQTQEFMTLYQKLYAQYAQSFPFLNPQVLALQAQMQTLALLQGEAPASPKLNEEQTGFQPYISSQMPSQPQNQWSSQGSKLEIIDDRTNNNSQRQATSQQNRFDAAFSSSSSSTSLGGWNRNTTSSNNNDVWS